MTSLNSSEVKKCRTCGVDKPAIEFDRWYVKGSGGKKRAGLKHSCRKCMYASKNSERRAAYVKKFDPSDRPGHNGGVCYRCKRRLGPELFHASSKHSHGKQVVCIECGKARKYGITVEEMREIREKQNGQCACCRCGLSISDEHVDHNHFNNMVRGLLCITCNAAIGFAKDNPDILIDMATYLMQNENGWR